MYSLASCGVYTKFKVEILSRYKKIKYIHNMYVYITTLNRYIGSTYNYICTVSRYKGPLSVFGSVMRSIHVVDQTICIVWGTRWHWPISSSSVKTSTPRWSCWPLRQYQHHHQFSMKLESTSSITLTSNSVISQAPLLIIASKMEQNVSIHLMSAALL